MECVKSCMITGHRKIDPCKVSYIEQKLRHEIMLAIENGYTHFISGFAEGTDLIFAQIVAELKSEHKVRLEAAIPYRKRMYAKDRLFKHLITKCDIVGIHCEEYTPSCFMARNRFMVEHCEYVIAVYDGRKKGGTLATMRLAAFLGKEMKIIQI